MIRRVVVGYCVGNIYLRGKMFYVQEKWEGVSLVKQLKVGIKERKNLKIGWQI